MRVPGGTDVQSFGTTPSGVSRTTVRAGTMPAPDIGLLSGT